MNCYGKFTDHGTTIARFGHSCYRAMMSSFATNHFVQEAHVLALIGLVLLVLWLLGFIAFHVTSGVIHILLVLAVISIIMHFLRGRTVA